MQNIVSKIRLNPKVLKLRLPSSLHSPPLTYTTAWPAASPPPLYQSHIVPYRARESIIYLMVHV